MSNVCCKCHEEITDRIISALGKSWHPHHFTCQHCQQPIETQNFNVHDNAPVCPACHLERHVHRCCCCNKMIMERTVDALGGKWHESCFGCCYCGVPLSNNTFYEIMGQIYCKDDFRALFAARCAGCGEPISGKATVALNTKWHPSCFKCAICESPITDNRFAVQKGKPVCGECVETSQMEE